MPALQYDLVDRLHDELPWLQIVVNGGLRSVEECRVRLASGIEGVMVGRWAWDNPWDMRHWAQELAPDSRGDCERKIQITRSHVMDEFAKFAHIELGRG